MQIIIREDKIHKKMEKFTKKLLTNIVNSFILYTDFEIQNYFNLKFYSKNQLFNKNSLNNKNIYNFNI